MALSPAAWATERPRAVQPRYLVVAPRALLPDHAKPLGALPATTSVSFELVLAPRNSAALDALVHSVTTPGSTDYRHFLSQGQFALRFGATPKSYEQISAVLRGLGLRTGRLSANGLTLEVAGTAAHIDAALRTRLSYLGLPTGRRLVANLRPLLLPRAIAPLVDGVLGLDTASSLAPAGLGVTTATEASASSTRRVAPHVAPPGAPSPSPSCASAIANAYNSTGAGLSADQIASAYDLDGLYEEGDVGAGTTVGVIEFSGYDSSDLAAYESCYGLNTQVTAVPVDGGPTIADPSSVVEAELDIEDLIGLAPGANLVVYEGPDEGGVTNEAAYNTVAAAVSADSAQVITTSWGNCEQAIGASVEKEENTVFEQAALQGQTVIAAAGDSGSEDCDGTLRGSAGLALAVDDPASQPFVTGVGGTTLTVAPARSEVVWNDGTNSASSGAGGGGVSSAWPMPEYQSDTSHALGVLTVNSAGKCGSPSGNCREVPDVSANAGTPYAMYCTVDEACGRSGWTGLFGTSASAPTWAAIVALADSSPACESTRPLGFINPALYAIGSGPGYATAFVDVDVGNNDLTGSNSGNYAAGIGYDLASGLGSPIAGSGSDSGLVAQLCSAVVEAAVSPTSGLPRPVVSKVTPASSRARGGAHVLLKGSDLEGASTVAFGSVPLPTGTFKVVSSSEIEAIVPPGTGHVHVFVTTRAGTSRAHRADTFTYLAPPVLSRITPTHGSAAGGEKIVLIGANLSDTVAVTFGSSRAIFVVRSSTRIVAVAPKGRGSVVVSVQTPVGHDTATRGDRFSYVS